MPQRRNENRHAARQSSGQADTRAFAGRHRFLLALFWVGIPVLAVIGLTKGAEIYEVIVTSVVLIGLAVVAMVVPNHTLAGGSVTVGLISGAGLVATYGQGSVEGTLVFVMVIVAVSFYRDWRLLLVGWAGTVTYHATAGFAINPPLVTDPMRWLTVNTIVVVVLAAFLVLGWHLDGRADPRAGSTAESFRLGFEKAPIGMAVLKPSGEFLQANDMMAALLGHHDGNLVGANIRSVIHTDDMGDLGAAWEQMGNGDGKTATAWLRCVTADGRAIWARVTLSLVAAAPRRPAVILLQIEDATRTHDEQERLERLLRDRDEYVATVGTEIGEALDSILELTARVDGVNPDLGRIVRTVDARTRELSITVDDLVVSARAETSPPLIVSRSLDAGAVCREVLRDIPGGEDVAMSIDATALVADPTMTRQILSSLVLNAIRYGGPSIELRTATSGPDTVIQVIDDGPEIPALERERIFNGDLRSGQPVTRPASVGLSLTVGRLVAHRMDGDLEYRRTPDGRNVFELRLPSEHVTIIEPGRARVGA